MDQQHSTSRRESRGAERRRSTPAGGPSPSGPTAPAVGGPPARIVALDLARLLAIVGMMSQHLLMLGSPAAVGFVSAGFPSTLFAVLGGVSAVVSTRRYREAGLPVAAAASVLARGAAVATVGMLLLLLTPGFVVIVLLYYGIAMMLTALVLHLRSPILLAAAALLAIAGPQLTAAVSGETVAGIASVASFVFLTGPYPVMTWFTYMLIGVLVGRAVLAPRGGRPPAVTLAAVGAVMLAVGTTADALRPAMTENSGAPLGEAVIALLNGAPHSGGTADVLRTAGGALLIIALLLAVTGHRAEVPLVARPVVRAGAAPLTIYTLHILVTSIATTVAGDALMTDPAWWQLGPLALALHVAGALLVGAVLMAVHRRGPLEAVVSAVARRGAGVGARIDRRAGRGPSVEEPRRV